MVEVTWAPGTVAPLTDIPLPAGSAAIQRAVSARLTRLIEGTPNTWSEGVQTPWSWTENTVQLVAGTFDNDLLVLQYEPVGEQVKP